MCRVAWLPASPALGGLGTSGVHFSSNLLRGNRCRHKIGTLHEKVATGLSPAYAAWMDGLWWCGLYWS
jgi:hypothetical protein